MLMKKFTGPTARDAMRKMKAELGAEAYVVSNRPTAAGVEIMAMTHASVEQMAAPVAMTAAMTAALPVSMTAAAPVVALAPAWVRPAAPLKTLRDIAVHLPPAAAAAPEPPVVTTVAPAPAPVPGLAAAAPIATAAAAGGPANNTAANHDERVLGELRSMKTLFESRLAGLAWRGMTQRRPLAAMLWRELTEAGYSPALARTIVARLPDDFAEAQARQWLRPQAGAAFAFQEDEMPMRSLPGLAAAPAGAGQ